MNPHLKNLALWLVIGLIVGLVFNIFNQSQPMQRELIFSDFMSKVERSRAQGVIFCMVKFCEPELFDLPQLMEGLKSKGIPVLLLDTELNQGLSGQMSTRVEAFVELLG